MVVFLTREDYLARLLLLRVYPKKYAFISTVSEQALQYIQDKFLLSRLAKFKFLDRIQVTSKVSPKV